MTAERISELAHSIAEIDKMDRLACIDRWQETFGRSPAKYLSPRFMKRVLIWELQTQKLGGVSKKIERTLRQIAGGKSPAAAAKPGSHLLREWNRRTYQVEATDDGYVLAGKSCRCCQPLPAISPGRAGPGHASL